MFEVSHASCPSALSAFTLMRHHFMHLPAMDSIYPEKSCLQNTFQQKTMAIYTYFPMTWIKEQLLVSLYEPSHPVPGENANVVQ